MRKLYVVADFPPTEDDMAAAVSLGATEIVSVPEGEDFPVNVPGYGYHEVEPDPPPLRRSIRKLVAQARVKTTGKLGYVWSILQSNPDAFGRWMMDGPNVYADDPEFIGLLTAAGLTAGEIATVTAEDAGN